MQDVPQMQHPWVLHVENILYFETLNSWQFSSFEVAKTNHEQVGERKSKTSSPQIRVRRQVAAEIKSASTFKRVKLQYIDPLKGCNSFELFLDQLGIDTPNVPISCMHGSVLRVQGRKISSAKVVRKISRRTYEDTMGTKICQALTSYFNLSRSVLLQPFA